MIFEVVVVEDFPVNIMALSVLVRSLDLAKTPVRNAFSRIPALLYHPNVSIFNFMFLTTAISLLSLQLIT